MTKSWILVGMMGAGKSAVGRALAEASGREFIDTDQILQGRFGRSISQFFAIYGEEAFRGHETSVLKSLEPGHNVISTGGGIVTRQENWEEFARLGTTIYLESSPEVLINRLALSKKKRPLLAVDNWEDKLSSLLDTRRELYEQADLRYSVDGNDIQAAAEGIIQLLEQRDAT
ncbi:MAG: shikimate kinase [Armatimonadetes bacterium]|jgi:shikimate kinase|nr:shikimate kinase [Armatimonadota bacterium]